MKTFFKKYTHRVKKAALIAALMLCFTGIFSQSAPELVFKNPVLVSGADGQDGAQYRFSNVSSGIDAIVQICGRSAPGVQLGNIDMTSSGWDKAFQPQLGKNGNVNSGDNWWMKFKIIFCAAGTSNRVVVDKVVVTGLDIDGDGQSLSEFAEADSVCHTNFSPTTMLNQQILRSCLDPVLPLQTISDLRIDGPVANYTDIDTAATNVMVTYTFLNKSEVNLTIGAVNGSGSTNAGMRLNSLWFKEFDLSTHTLPVTLTDFSAMLRNDKADLKWITATESNVSHFMVERSTDGKDFSDAALVFAYGNSTIQRTYQFSDDLSKISGGVVYYRLKMQDDDGSFTYSPTRMLKLDKPQTSLSLSLYPNPVVNEVKVTIPASWQGNPVVYEVFNTNGQKVFERRNEYASQTESISLTSCQRGVYIVKASNEIASAQNKIIKN